jgi:hypothetical protein
MILYLPETAPIDAPGMAYSMLSPWDVAAGQLVILIALLSFLAGHAVPTLRLLRPGSAREGQDWTPSITFSVGVVLILIGWPISTAATLGLIPASLGSGIITTLGSSLVFGHVLLALAYFRHGMRVAMLVLCFTIPVTSLIGFFSGSKTAAVLAPAFVALTYIFERRRVPLSLLAAGTLALAVMYPASEFLRIYMLGTDFRFTAEVLLDPAASAAEVSSFVQSNDLGNYLSDGFSAVGARLDLTGVVSVIVRDTPRLSPFQYGSTLVLFFVSFVPRAFWPDKPNIAIGQFITDVYGSGPEIESSTAPTQIGDFYLNFGYAGVIIGMIVLGLALRLAADLLLGRRMTATTMLAAIAVAYSAIFGFETNVALAQARMFFFLVPIVALHYAVAFFVVGRRTPSRAPENAS